MLDQYAVTPINFTSLREHALADIAQLAPDSWTDHTTSDPGITILEQLIVQFTRLAEKLQLPLADLLVSDGDIQSGISPAGLAFPKPQALKDQFFTANEVLSCAPVSLNDRRRLLLDHPLVANVLVEPVRMLAQSLYWNNTDKAHVFDELEGDQLVHLPGRYRALVELVPDHGLSAEQKQALSDELFNGLKPHRNLCELWQEVIVMEPEWIKIKGGISLKQGADVEQTLIDLHKAISDYINPPLHARSKAEMGALGLGAADIYQGPVLENGYYAEADLNSIKVRDEVRVSDIIRLILDFEQVAYVHRLQLSNFGSPKDDDWRNWVLPVSSGRVARLVPLLVTDPLDPGAVLRVTDDFITCFKQDAPCPVDAGLIEQRQQANTLAAAQALQQRRWYDLRLPEGNRQDLAYRSLQEEFPVVYGLGDNQLPDSVGQERLAKVKQLQGYLLMFDQVLANYHQQLANMGQMLDSKQRPASSYHSGEFSAAGQSVLTAEDYWLQIKALVSAELTTNIREHHHDRENRLLSHLFARLGESFSDHSLLGFSFDTQGISQYLQSKQQCLAQSAALAHDRFVAQDYLSDAPCGVVRRLVARLGLVATEGVPQFPPEPAPVLIEHSLLYPRTPREIYPTGQLSAQLRSDGHYYTILTSPDHGLRDGEMISLFDIFDIDGNKETKYGGAYPVTLIDKDTVELTLDLKLDPDTDEINKVFSLRWLRGTEAPTEPPEIYHTGQLSAQLRRDGYYYTILTSPDHGLRDGEMISLFAIDGDKETEYGGAYPVTLIDKDTVDLALDLKLDPDTDEINKVFSLRWLRGTEVSNPYAYRVSLLFQGGQGRFADPEFRRSIEVMARAETPAHIALNLRWLDEQQWPKFEGFYNEWHALIVEDLAAPGDELAEVSNARAKRLDQAANKLLAFLL